MTGLGFESGHDEGMDSFNTKPVNTENSNENTGSKTETLSICPNCGEPTVGDHTCGELSKLVSENPNLKNILGPIIDEAKTIWEQEQGGEIEVTVARKLPKAPEFRTKNYD